MKKTNSVFKLAKTVKRMIALMDKPKHIRTQFKNMMIDAQLAAAIIPSKEKKQNSEQK